MKSQARIVIVGGGIMGVALLYHLAEEGCSDVLLIEKGELTSGSTWHAAGQCPSLVANYNLAKIHNYSNWLYPRLEELTGQYVSWHASGGNVRVDLEDNLYLEKGVFASDAELVERACNIVQLMGCSIQSPSEARETLGLREKP